jgi:G3E family GTPase
MENQIKFSTQILLTKQRDLSKEQINQLAEEIKTIKPDAAICLDNIFDLDDEQIMELTQNNPVVYPDDIEKSKHAALKSVTLYPKKLYEAKELENIMNDLKNGITAISTD